MMPHIVLVGRHGLVVVPETCALLRHPTFLEAALVETPRATLGFAARPAAGGGDGQVLAILAGGVVGVVMGLICVVLALVRGQSLGWSIKWSSIATSVVCIGLVAMMVS